MTRRWLTRTDADEDVGFGHLSRSLALAQAGTDLAIDTTFAFRFLSAAGAELLHEHGYTYVRLDPATSLVEERRQLEDLARAESADGLILDITHPKTPRKKMELAAYLSSSSLTTCLIDGLNPDSFHRLLGRQLQVDLLVVPYVGAVGVIDKQPTRVLAGPQYAIFPQELSLLAGRKEHFAAPPPADRILVTTGGADPAGVTELALDALEQLRETPPFEVHLVLGPFFGDARRTRIEERIQSLPWAEAIHSPPHLGRELLWADLAIATTGLTKYELALFAVPAVFISLDTIHHTAHQPFAERGTGTDLGPRSSVTSEALAASIERLRGDRELRCEMAANGRALVDGDGAHRVASEMRERMKVNRAVS